MTSWGSSVLKEAQGAISLPNNKYGIILSESSEWLERLNIKETSDIFTIYYGKSYIPKRDDGIGFIDIRIDRGIWAVLKISDDKKVDPLMFYDVSLPIQNFEDLSSKFEWIEPFYRELGLPAGYGYYDQKDINEPEDYFEKHIEKLKSSLPEKL